LKTNPWIAAVAFTLAISGAQACGPDFPVMLTTCRSACLLQIRGPGFAYDIANLSNPAPGHRGSEAALATSTVDTVGWEQQDSEPGAALKIAQMRAADSGEQAYAMGAGLAPAKRLYTAGAVEFNHVHVAVAWQEGWARAPAPAQVPTAEALDQGLTAAIQWFEKVTQLSSKEAEPRIVWATFMLARSHELRKRPDDAKEAQAQYRRTIELVEKGRPDPLGLGNFALGALGRLAIRQGDYAAAASLYLRQGDTDHAKDSLSRLALAIPEDQEVLQRAIKDPVVQRLLIAFALRNADSTCSSYGETDCGQQFNRYVPNRGPGAAAIVQALGTLNPRQVEWPDQAAALAFGVSNYEVAARLLKVTDAPYADWIRGKIALHQGDMDAALKAFASASKRFATPRAADANLPDDATARFHAEHAVLLLSRSDYVEALYQLSNCQGYEDDALYVAERVLTLDELKALVDKESWAGKYRDLLARRLARADRLEESLSYYEMPEVKPLAGQYVAGRRQALTASDALTRAQAWYQVSRLEIQSGMELLGTERCPDYTEYQGGFAGPCGQMAETAGDLTSADELSRVAASAAEPDLSFHYRTIAVRHLFLAADALPRHSEVLSAVLCNGVGWLQRHNRSNNEELIQLVYGRYLKQGRPEPWTVNFGSRCPPPDFGSAAPP
jgi:hypothetical protein